ncbi:MAG: TonB-dependent receptor [Thermodesulfobacteriota bacterium]
MRNRKIAVRRCRIGGAALLLGAMAAWPAAAPAAADTAGGGQQLGLYFDESALVEAPTRSAKPLSEIAENVTVVSGAEIEAMNVHNLADVLQRVTGVFVDSRPAELVGDRNVTMQGSRTEHVLVLVDGVRLNSAGLGAALFDAVPLAIIERIEVIKGPASSTWGSSLGGVINVVTRKTGSGERPGGSLSGTYGEAATQDYNGDIAGGLGKLGYYLYAGHQETDGLVGDRFGDNGRFYGKTSLALPGRASLTASFGYGDLDFNYGDFPSLFSSYRQRTRNHWAAAVFEKRLSEELHLTVGLRQYDFDWTQSQMSLDPTFRGNSFPGEWLWDTNYVERSTGANFHLSWQHSIHSFGLGGETNREVLTKNTFYGPFAQSPWPPGWGLPAVDSAPTVRGETSGLYLNDTLHLGSVTVTPGLRYDHHSMAGELLSPSLGATWRLSETTLLRAAVSQGFVQPLLSYLGTDDLFQDPNPDLEAERITSYQFGGETLAVDGLRLKCTLFEHDLRKNWEQDSNNVWVNGGKTRRQGFELEAETTPWHHLTLKAGHVYVHEQPRDGRHNDSSAKANLGLTYDDGGLRAQLAGSYVWWNTLYDASPGSSYGTPLWDLSLTKRLTEMRPELQVFATVHNLFSGSENTFHEYTLPDRWAEAGIRIHY